MFSYPRERERDKRRDALPAEITAIVNVTAQLMEVCVCVVTMVPNKRATPLSPAFNANETSIMDLALDTEQQQSLYSQWIQV